MAVRAREWTPVPHSSSLVMKGSPVRVRASALPICREKSVNLRPREAAVWNTFLQMRVPGLLLEVAYLQALFCLGRGSDFWRWMKALARSSAALPSGLAASLRRKRRAGDTCPVTDRDAATVSGPVLGGSIVPEGEGRLAPSRRSPAGAGLLGRRPKRDRDQRRTSLRSLRPFLRLG